MNIFIGSGSKPEIDDKYLIETKNICYELGKLNYNLVFGAYNSAMMGVCYKTFKENSKNILGISLYSYKDDLASMPNLNVKFVDNNFERLALIYKSSDIFLILPGGVGTLSEIFGILEEFKKNKQDKKLIIYNYNGFYDKLIEFIKEKNKENFIYEDDYSYLTIVNNISDLKKECLK